LSRDWKVGSLEVWRLGRLEAWKFGSLEVWKFGGLEAWRLGGLAKCEAKREKREEFVYALLITPYALVHQFISLDA
jgi:hypothetical protein